MKKYRIIIFIIFVFGIVSQIKSQIHIQKSAIEKACNCIDSLTIQNTTVPLRDSIINCFYKGVSYAINKQYYKNGKLRLSGKRFFVLSGDLLYHLQENLYFACDAYQYYIDTTKTEKIRFK